MRVRDLLDNSEYDMPPYPAILRAIKGDVILLDDPTLPIVKSIQDAITELRSQVVPLSQKDLEKYERYKKAETWEACLDALRPLLAKMFSEGAVKVSIPQIKERASKDPFLKNYLYSLARRVWDLEQEGFLAHYYQDGKMVTGWYVRGPKFAEKP